MSKASASLANISSFYSKQDCSIDFRRQVASPKRHIGATSSFPWEYGKSFCRSAMWWSRYYQVWEELTEAASADDYEGEEELHSSEDENQLFHGRLSLVRRIEVVIFEKFWFVEGKGKERGWREII